MQDFKSMKKALTIGELLITMSIIGVIAVLVLPGFLKDYHKKVYTAKLKKTIEVIDNAVNQACIDNNVSYFYQTPYPASSTKIQEFMKKYFKTVESDANVFYDGRYTAIDPSLSSLSSSSFSGSSKGKIFNPKNAVKLASGEAISFDCNVSTGGSLAVHAANINLCTIRVDVNAADGPNIGGRDMFTLYLDINNNSLNSRTRISLETALSEGCRGNELGEYCYNELLEHNWIMDY